MIHGDIIDQERMGEADLGLGGVGVAGVKDDGQFEPAG
jgi:hypothetical protein